MIIYIHALDIVRVIRFEYMVWITNQTENVGGDKHQNGLVTLFQGTI